MRTRSLRISTIVNTMSSQMTIDSSHFRLSTNTPVLPRVKELARRPAPLRYATVADASCELMISPVTPFQPP